jgi:hypothetical protein
MVKSCTLRERARSSSSLSAATWRSSCSQGTCSARMRPPRPSRSRGVRYHCADMVEGATELAAMLAPSSKAAAYSASSLRVAPVLLRLRPLRGVVVVDVGGSGPYGALELENCGVLDRLGRSVTTDSGEMERSAGKVGSCCEAARECVGEKGGGGMLHTSGVRGQASSGGNTPFGDMGVGVLDSEDTAIPKWLSSGVGGRGMFGCGPASRDTRLEGPRRGRMASCVVSETVYFWFLSDVRGRDSNSSDAALFSPW